MELSPHQMLYHALNSKEHGFAFRVNAPRNVLSSLYKARRELNDPDLDVLILRVNGDCVELTKSQRGLGRPTTPTIDEEAAINTILEQLN